MRGAVHLVGPPPSLPPVPTNASVARACGPSIPDRSLEVDPAGGLVDAVVWVDSPPVSGSAEGASADAAPSLTLTQTKCDYVPHVLAARAGGTLAIVNGDPLVHSIHGAEGGRVLFNFAQPITGMRAERTLPRTPGVVALRCELHPWMHAFVRVFDHPYFALTTAGGRFELHDVPAGRHTLTVWQPRLGQRQLSIDVRAGMAPVQVEWRTGG